MTIHSYGDIWAPLRAHSYEDLQKASAISRHPHSSRQAASTGANRTPNHRVLRGWRTYQATGKANGGGSNRGIEGKKNPSPREEGAKSKRFEIMLAAR